MWHPGLPSPPPRGSVARRGAQWAWLAAATVARGYLVFVLALVCCALAPLSGGLSGSVVQSGSMQPHIDPGDVVLTSPMAKDADVPLGRVVTFEAPKGSLHEGIVLHRIVAVNDDGTLTTQGDANAQADSAPLDRENILARAVILVPYIGLPSLWVTSGNLGALAGWIALTIVALLIESARLLAIPHKHRLVRPRPARSPILATFALRAGPFVTVAAAVAVISVSAFGQTSAGFTAKTQNVGNNWAVAAAGPGTKLSFVTSPSASTGGVAFPTQPVVVVQDASGRTANTTAAQVTLEITTPAGAVLTCASNPQAATSGWATFSGCSITKNGTYTLTARSGTLTAAVSASFVISVGPAARLQFTTQPSATVVANTALATQPRVTVQDAGGNTITASTAPVTLALTTPGSAVLTCTTNPQTAVAGLATFAGCKVNLTGIYTLKATSGSLTLATSASFTVTPGAATKLAFQTSPSNTAVNVAFASQPVVVIQDANGNTVTTSTASITLALTTAGGATFTCTTNPKAAVAGTATFDGCKVNLVGTYTLKATSSGLTQATSASFNVTAGAATKLAFQTNPSSAVSNTAFATQPVVLVQDASGNIVTTSTAPVTLALTTPGGSTLSCTTNPQTAASGIATFAGCKVNLVGTYTLTATSAGLTQATSTSFTITPGAAAKLAFQTNPSNAATNVAFATQPVVVIQDASGNTVSSTASVTLALTTPGGATLTCTTNPRAAVAGTATFSGCRVNLAGTYTLKATSGVLTLATSASFVIS